MTDTTAALPPMPRALDVVEPEPAPAPAPVEETKRWWQSKGVIGAIIVILVLAARQLGYEITNEDQASLTDAIVNLTGTLGALLALVGRLTATKQVASQVKPPLQVIREAGEINRRQVEEMRAADTTKRKAKSQAAAAQARAVREANMRKMLENSNKVRASIPRNDETTRNMALTEEMLRIKRERR